MALQLLLVKCCFQDLLKTARSIIVQFPFSFFFKYFAKVQVVQPCNSIDMVTVVKNSRFILFLMLDFHMFNNKPIALHAISMRKMTSLSVDEILLPSYVK